MEQKNLEFKIGLLIVIALIVGVSFFLFMNGFSLNDGKYIYVDFTFSGAIQEGAPIKISGVKIGKVKKMEFMFGKVNKYNKNILVRLHAYVYNEYFETIRENSQFFITTAGILGENYLGIEPGDFSKPSVKENEIFMGIEPPKMDLIIAKTSQLINDITILLSNNSENIGDLVKNASTLTKTVNEVLTENKETIKTTLTNTNKLIENTIVLTDSINNSIQDGTNIKNIIGNVSQMTFVINKKLNPLLTNVDMALNTTNSLLNETSLLLSTNKDNIKKALDNTVKLTDTSNVVLTKADSMVTEINDGKGNIGMFLKTSEIYAGVKELVFTLKKSPWKVLWRGE